MLNEQKNRKIERKPPMPKSVTEPIIGASDSHEY
jgi:hypothetical protein